MKYLDKKFITKLRKDYHQKEKERKQIIEKANQLLHSSKRIIFGLHRGEVKKMEKELALVEKSFQELNKSFKPSRLAEEGSFKAAAEEYVEAKMFFKILKKEKVGEVQKLELPRDSYLGGLCDLVGELVRLATNKAASGQSGEVKEIKEMINEIVEELIQFDFTGYLRNKYDQARVGLRKIEQIDYEINIKK